MDYVHAYLLFKIWVLKKSLAALEDYRSGEGAFPELPNCSLNSMFQFQSQTNKWVLEVFTITLNIIEIGYSCWFQDYLTLMTWN